MRCLWSATFAGVALAGLLLQDAAAQRYERDDEDRETYSSQFGSDRSRTSRDYGQDRRNDFSGDDSNEDRSQRRRHARTGDFPPGVRDFDQDNNDAPHSATRTERRNRFDDEQARFADDDYSSGSHEPRRSRSATRLEDARHDYSEGMWSRALRSARDAETLGENNERFAAGTDEFIRQHDEDEDNELSRREMPQGMLEYFHDLDANSDDQLSRGELQQHGQRMTQWLEQDELASTSSHGFARRTRVVPVEATYVWIMDTGSGNVRLDDLQGAYDLLQRLDSNNDGNITRSELRDRRQHVVSRWIEHGFQRLDENEDDAISRDEATSSMLQERFDVLDLNGDEKLTRGELRRSGENASRWWGPQDEDAYLSEGPDGESRR